MAKYLSDEWGKEMQEALNNDEAFRKATGNLDVVVQQIVTNAPDRGEINYWLQIKNGMISWNSGRAEKADATLTQSYETAAAMDRGELNSQVALSQGKLKFGGNLGLVMKAGPSLQCMVPVLQSLPTEY